MTIFIWVITVVAVMQFVWYAIVAPSLRMRLRYDLFSQRDRLRMLRIQHEKDMPMPVYSILDQRVNSAISMLRYVELSTIFTFTRELARNQQLCDKIERRQAIIDNCPIRDVRDISDSVGKTISIALFVNSAGWLPWLAPIIGGMICWKTILNSVKQLLSVRPSEVVGIDLAREALAS
jgi:hypothetical protein